MKRYTLFFVATLLAAAGAARGESRRVVFESAGVEHTWPLKDLGANLPADWSGFQFLVLELRLSSPQRFDFKVHDAEGVRSVRLAPVPGAWIRAAVPLRFLTEPAGQGHDLASVHNKPRPMIFINLSGTPGPLKAVREVGVVMANPIGAPSLEIRSMRLVNEDPGDSLLDGKPLVDPFGQWIGDDWPGKAISLDQLKAAWTAEQKALAAAAQSKCPYGGYENTRARATGFFRVEKIEGKWWFVDPDGHLFLSIGSDSIGTSVVTPTSGREQLFAAIPPNGSFYAANLARRFGTDWSASWVDLTVRRMFAWGFNTAGNWSDTRLGASHRIPYVVTLRGWGLETGPMGVPDVYAPTYAASVDQAAAQQCAPHKEDAFVLGYFIGNEPPWPGRETIAANAILTEMCIRDSF